MISLQLSIFKKKIFYYTKLIWTKIYFFRVSYMKLSKSTIFERSSHHIFILKVKSRFTTWPRAINFVGGKFSNLSKSVCKIMTDKFRSESSTLQSCINYYSKNTLVLFKFGFGFLRYFSGIEEFFCVVSILRKISS